MDKFNPVNELERNLLNAQAGVLSIQDFHKSLLRENLSIPTVAELQTDGSGLVPLIFSRDGITRVVVFSDPDRALTMRKKAAFLLVTNGLRFFTGLSSDLGIVLNPGFSAGLEMTPEAVQNLVFEYGKLKKT